MNDKSNWNKTVSRLLSQATPGSLPPLPSSASTRKKIAPRIPVPKAKVDPTSTSNSPRPKHVPKPKPLKTHEKHKFALDGVGSVFGSNSFEKKSHTGVGGGIKQFKNSKLQEPKTESKLDVKPLLKPEVKDEKQLLKEFMKSEMSVVSDDCRNEMLPDMLTGKVYNPEALESLTTTAASAPDLKQLLTDPKLKGQPFLLYVPSSLLKPSEGLKTLQEGPVARLRVRQSGKVEIQIGPLEGCVTPNMAPNILQLPTLIHNSNLTLLTPTNNTFNLTSSFTTVLD